MGETWADRLEPVLREAHRRLSAGTEVSSLTVRGLSRDEAEALADLLGWSRRPGAVARVDLSALTFAVTEMTGRRLPEVLAARYGPIGDAAGDRAQARREREALWTWWHEAVDALLDRSMADWAQEVAASGLRGTVPSTRALLQRVLDVLDALPADDEPLPVLAGRLLNDTHALDGGALPTLVLGGVAAKLGLPRALDTEQRRVLWRAVGVSDDELSSTVLVAGMRPADGPSAGLATTLCAAAAAHGSALSLTLAQLRWEPTVPLLAGSTVFVVENPAILALAVRSFGTAVPPMVCVSGWPSTAASTLLRGMSAASCRLRYHGDLDGEGVRIAAHIHALSGATPWRMSAAEYLSHVEAHGAPVGRVTNAPWDDDLAPAMRTHGVAVLEETVWPVLRGDLAAASSGDHGPGRR